ncbi:MAG TPA: bacillithiol biosynthesis cysteine-adding enzyme BshC [Flavobacteriaceae bacterium]|nr:bacillithiol biosynthesis cysteine-adding enzyme BshC [Flavobacteriaceae bacterium]
MPAGCISYKDSGYFSSLILDYLDKNPEVGALYSLFPSLENFKLQIAKKENSYSVENRKVLTQTIVKQYDTINISKATQKHIEQLKLHNTFTVTTGHQLNLFTGPLYFLYKIVSTVNLCKILKEKYSNYHFVPVYWMATEDHDFEEINHFNFRGKKVVWNKKTSGAVGRISTEGLEEVFSIFSAQLGDTENAKYLKKLFENSYLKHDNLADATRYLANELFGEQGLIIIDADDTHLKKCFIPYLREEILHQTSFKSVSDTIEKFDKKYGVQVNPREINLFYLDENIRERIVENEGVFRVKNTTIFFSKEEILKEINQHPEKFSPNVLTRPLYQETVLPNLCYIGGGGEIAYWLQLKNYFDQVNVPFPILLLRNSAVLAPEKIQKKVEKIGLTIHDLFLKTTDLQNLYIRKTSPITIDFTPQRELLKQQFSNLYEIAEKTHKSFKNAVAAQEKKQLNGLDYLEKRLLKAQKRKHADELNRLVQLKESLFPQGGLQERTDNFSQWYLNYGKNLFAEINKNLNPLQLEFTILPLD